MTDTNDFDMWDNECQVKYCLLDTPIFAAMMLEFPLSHMLDRL